MFYCNRVCIYAYGELKIVIISFLILFLLCLLGLDSEAKTGRPAQGSGAMGVRELARIFSTRSKEETNERVTHRKTAPKGTHWAISSQSSVPFTSSSSSSSKTEDKTTCRSKTVKERSKTDLNNDTDKSVETTDTIKVKYHFTLYIHVGYSVHFVMMPNCSISIECRHTHTHTCTLKSYQWKCIPFLSYYVFIKPALWPLETPFNDHRRQ